MAKALGLPPAIAARLILEAPPVLTACQVPTEPATFSKGAASTIVVTEG